ncbi:MAG: T9SS type A sorting domain-containing protein, partial [Melioribacteraceae bacterium]
VSKSIWAGNFINNLENENYNLTNEKINEIIDFSIDNRVLSRYTSFICLEPSLGGEIYYDAVDESDLIIRVEDAEETKTDSIFQAYPNPFNNQTTIQIRMSKEIDLETSSFKIYNVLGKVVKTFEPSINVNTKGLKFIWNGKNDNNSNVSSGHYFFVMNYSGKVKSLKLLLLK